MDYQPLQEGPAARRAQAECARRARSGGRASRGGARLGVRECQFQFRFGHWNCSSHSKAFGRILQQGQCGEDPRRGLLSRVEEVRGEGGGGGEVTKPHFPHWSKGHGPDHVSQPPRPRCLAPTAAPQNPSPDLAV